MGDIISDAIVYPFNNIKSLVIFAVLGIIAGVLGGASILGFALGSTGKNAIVADGFGIVELIIFFIIALLISGYTLDILKYGIERRDDGPGVDFVRQVTNAIRLIIVGLVYYIIPSIIIWLLFFLLGNGILTIIINFIIAVVFVFAEFMAKCRLAKYDSLGEALAIGTAIGDISQVGMLRILAIVIMVAIIGAIVVAIIVAINRFNTYVGGVLFGIFLVYFVFFYNRALGLLYSEVE